MKSLPTVMGKTEWSRGQVWGEASSPVLGNFGLFYLLDMQVERLSMQMTERQDFRGEVWAGNTNMGAVFMEKSFLALPCSYIPRTLNVY